MQQSFQLPNQRVIREPVWNGFVGPVNRANRRAGTKPRVGGMQGGDSS
jgi:hypothetical protein